jgi:hypothetical protein
MDAEITGARARPAEHFILATARPTPFKPTSRTTIVIQDLGGNLYFSTQKITNGIWKISGTPTAPAAPTRRVQNRRQQAATYGFAFNPSYTTAYLADDTLKGSGGIQRWDFNGGAWAMTYAFTSLTNVGARGVAVDFSGAHPVIYATTAENSTNRLVSITDTGAASAVTTLATAGVNQLFRGVTLAPGAPVNPQILAGVNNPGGFALTATAWLARNYTVQWTADLANPVWTTLTNLTATLPTLTVTDAGAPANTNRFYRIILNP